MSEKISVLKQYSKQGAARSPGATGKSKPQEGKEPYRAYGIETGRHGDTMMRVEHHTGLVELIERSLIRRMFISSDQYVAILFDDNEVMTLEGKNLARIVDLLQDKQIRTLHCFNAERHQEPEERNDPVILAIGQQNQAEFMQSLAG